MSLVRHALGHTDELVSYPELVNERFEAWLHQQQQTGRSFTDHQTAYLSLIKERLSTSLTVAPADLQNPPFSTHGGLGKARPTLRHGLEPASRRANPGPRRMTNDLPPGWAETEVGNIGKVEYGKGLRNSQRVSTGPVEVYGSAGLVGHHDQALIDEPAVIVGRKGNAGAVWYTTGPSWPIDTTYFLRIPKELSVEYLGLPASPSGSCRSRLLNYNPESPST